VAQAKGLPSMIYHEPAIEVKFMRGAAGTARILTIRAQGHTYLRRQDRLMQCVFRSAYSRLSKSKRGVHRLHAQEDAPFRILAETRSGKRCQLPGLGLLMRFSHHDGRQETKSSYRVLLPSRPCRIAC
jgi:hypothetical protein